MSSQGHGLFVQNVLHNTFWVWRETPVFNQFPPIFQIETHELLPSTHEKWREEQEAKWMCGCKWSRTVSSSIRMCWYRLVSEPSRMCWYRLVSEPSCQKEFFFSPKKTTKILEGFIKGTGRYKVSVLRRQRATTWGDWNLTHTRWSGGRSCPEERKWRKYLCFVYFQEIKRELKTILKHDCRCNERLTTKVEGVYFPKTFLC